MLRRVSLLILLLLTCAAGAWWWIVQRPLQLPSPPYTLSIKPGTSLRGAARELTRAGVIPGEWVLVGLARFTGADRNMKAGSYEFAAGTTLAQLLAKLSQGDVLQTSFTIVEGWTFAELKDALRQRDDVSKTAIDLNESELMRRIGAAERQAEGLFLPETYFFAAGDTDLALLTRAYRMMHDRVATAWAARAPDLPLATPYEAVILASLVEKETGRPADRPLVASVFINRLKQGMRLQTDPTVIYGLGASFDGRLRREHLETDQAYNTYTREGLPPTPIAFPSQASLDAVMHPPSSPYLYFVARGDGSSEFSTTLVEHNRAVAKYQRGRR